MTGVYVIRNSNTGDIYIGSSSTSIAGRWRTHRCELRNKYHGNPRLQNSVNKHGEGSFTFTVLEECPPEQCLEREQWWIDFLKPEFNCCPVAGSRLGTRQTEDSRIKMSEAKRREDNPLRGKPLSEEHRRKLSESKKGKATRIGFKHTEETKAKMRAKAAGRKLSQEHREKLKGRTHSEASKQKMSEAHKGKVSPRRGVKLTDAHRQHLRDGWARRRARLAAEAA